MSLDDYLHQQWLRYHRAGQHAIRDMLANRREWEERKGTPMPDEQRDMRNQTQRMRDLGQSLRMLQVLLPTTAQSIHAYAQHVQNLTDAVQTLIPAVQELLLWMADERTKSERVERGYDA